MSKSLHLFRDTTMLLAGWAACCVWKDDLASAITALVISVGVILLWTEITNQKSP